MSKEKQIYQANRERVFSIYGIDPQDRRYNIHHILFKSDFENHPEWPKEYRDSKANLCPLTIEEHERLHQKVEEQEGYVIYRDKRKRRRKHKRR